MADRDVKPANVSPPPAVTPSSTGTPCRVCHVDDGDERVQPDLHRRCMERATKPALERRARTDRARAARAPRRGRELGRAELLERLARDRGDAGGGRDVDQPRGRGRPRKGEARRDVDPDEGPELTADEAAAVELITRGGGLATGGLGAEAHDDA